MESVHHHSLRFQNIRPWLCHILHQTYNLHFHESLIHSNACVCLQTAHGSIRDNKNKAHFEGSQCKQLINFCHKLAQSSIANRQNYVECPRTQFSLRGCRRIMKKKPCRVWVGKESSIRQCTIRWSSRMWRRSTGRGKTHRCEILNSSHSSSFIMTHSRWRHKRHFWHANWSESGNKTIPGRTNSTFPANKREILVGIRNVVLGSWQRRWSS